MLVLLQMLMENFRLKQKATDTLYIQGLSYNSKKYVLTEKDFWLEELEKLDYI